MDKKGVGWGGIVGIILLVVFLWTGVKIIAPILSEDFQFSLQENICRITLGLHKSFDIAGVRFLEPLCKPQLITYNADLIKKYKEKGETTKYASMRYLAEKMNRCQKIYNIESMEAAWQKKDCYVCYALQSDTKDPLQVTFSQEDFTKYITTSQTPQGRAYIRELQKEGHQYLISVEGDIFDPSKNDYGILYVDNVEVEDLYHIIGGGTTAVTGTVCLISVFLTGPLAIGWCGAALLAAGTEGYLLKQEFIGDSENLFMNWKELGGTNQNLAIVKELKVINSFCSNIITS